VNAENKKARRSELVFPPMQEKIPRAQSYLESGPGVN
jgi:hypothetical protein